MPVRRIVAISEGLVYVARQQFGRAFGHCVRACPRPYTVNRGGFLHL